MRMYKDIVTGDRMFSDIYKVKLVDEVIYEVTGKLVIRAQVDRKVGSSRSAREMIEGTDSVVDVESGIDIVLNHRLCETFAFGDKKSYILYLKRYMKKIVAKLEEKAPEQVAMFKTIMNRVMRDILERFKDLQFFTGESMDYNGMVAMCEYRNVDGVEVPIMMFFKHGLEKEKFTMRHK